MAVVFPLPGGGSFILGGGLDSLFQDIQDLFTFILPVISKEEGERGRVFLGILEQLDEISAGNISIDEFLVNIEDFFPASPSTTGRMSDLAEQAQYNGFLSRFEEILNSEDPSSAAQDLFRQYETAGIADNTFIQNSFSFTNPQQIMDRAVLGDGDIGVTVDVCTSPGQTNCVDPKAINDLWEDFGRHVRVIFKGLQIPGLPEWLPLPGIMRLPTIGEIWDRITGPFNDAAREQMKECMNKDDDGDGVKNTASYCMENRDIVGIITQGILDGAGDIVDATTDAMGEIVDKALETLDCVTDPAACARTIKDTIEGVLGGADPTQPGLPPWMRAIIIGSQYGDEILKELEKIFDSDINGDGTIGITQDYCADGVTIKEDAEGTNCPEYAQFGYCTDGTTKKQDSAGTNCPDYVPDYGMCDDGLTKKEDAEGTNCPGPEPVVNEGDPCNLENEGTGTYQYVGDELQCIPDPPEFGFCQDGVTEKADAEGTNCDEYEGPEPTPCPNDGEVRRGGLDDGYCVKPGQSCQSEPTKYAGDDPNINVGQFNSEGFCVAPDGGPPDDTGGQCPVDSERAGQNPVYDSRDTNQSGFFTTPNGITYTYEPCNPSLGFSIVGQNVNVCEDQNNLNYGNIVQQPEEPCGDCNPGFDKPEGYDTCVSIVEVLCKDDNVSGNYEECGGPEQPPEETNCAQQGKVTNEDGSCGGCDTEKGYVLSELTGRCYIPQTGDCAPDADGNPQVRDGWGRCVPIGSECRAESFGGQDCRDPETNAYQFGVIDADGSCVCPGDIEEPPEEPPEEPCPDENRQKNNDGSCGENCNAGFDQPAGYDVCTSIEQLCADGAEGYGTDNELCGTSNGCPEGQKKFDGENCDNPCPTNPDVGANSLDCVAPQCDNDATNYPDCNQCPKGKILNDQGVCVTTDVASCDEQNRVTNDDGTCGECKAGYTFDTNQDLCVADGGDDKCANGATDFPACTTCPEGQSMDEEGNCVGVTPPPETGGGGGGGGMMGSFTPFLAGISYTPQAVPEPPAPAQKDYMAELDNIIKRSLFEGMA